MSPQALRTQLKNAVGNLSTPKKISLFALIVGTLLGFFILMAWTGQQEFQVVYSRLAPEDAGGILTFLKEKKIPYRMSDNGRAIAVPATQVHECRLALAAQGLPQGGGIGFEVFDNTKLGMTEFVQNVNYQRALQGELSRTINKISEVESSRVHVVMPARSLFVEEDEPASASVVLRLKRGKWLNNDQIQGIVHLVSSSVSRLEPEQVTVVDHTGKMLAGNRIQSPLARLSSDQLEYKQNFERGLENRVRTMLEKALGRDKAIVRLSCDLDFKRQEMTEERFYPDNRVVRSEQILQEKSGEDLSIQAGVPGLRANTTKPTEDNGEKGRSAFEKQDRTVNYEIGKITSHVVEPAAKLKRISVAVLVDGSYQSTLNDRGVTETRYVPRTEAELAQIKNIVKNAVNFDSARGDTIEVAHMAFETAETDVPLQADVESGWFESLKSYTAPLRYAFLTFFVLMSFLFVVRPILKWLTGSGDSDAEILRQLPKTVNEIESEYGGGSESMPNRDELNRLLATDSQAGVEVMRDWLKER
jgi:flagellar M-ring protein FliF